jgi:PAS domain S-box-containing protein
MPTDELEPSNRNVLLVEDNDDDAALLERHLRRNGFVLQITRVQTAPEMLAVLDPENPPEIVLADYNLPNFSGPEALQVLKSTGLDIPFIMLSGEVSEETAVSSMRSGAHDYVSKQNLARLIPAIQRELNEALARRNRVAAELALRASEARFHSLVEAMPLCLLISNASGRITYANGAAERLLGYSRNDLLSGAITLESICSPLGECRNIPGNSREPFESLCTTSDGRSIEVLIGVTFLNPDAPEDESRLAAFIADLSLQKKSEEVLRRTEKLAVAGRLAASISHEINNPLEAITNCLFLVAQGDLSNEVRGYLELAQKELDRVAQVTVQTLRFYRASTRATHTDIHELIATVLILVESRLRLLQIDVVRDFRADPIIFAHDGEIRQVVANLVGNAIDAVSEGGRIVIRTSNTRDWSNDRDGLSITIADNGAGMDGSTRSRVFEPFFSTKGNTGTGLGLWISDEIASKHDGFIHVRSRQSVSGIVGGSVFRFFLPTRDDSTA